MGMCFASAQSPLARTQSHDSTGPRKRGSWLGSYLPALCCGRGAQVFGGEPARSAVDTLTSTKYSHMD